ncbi:class I SAM-dependent methyltransferase [Cellulomonas uda]|uniref:Methyltransferase type 11 n=1 Tax=Cellulomonas uda TaxID=1714 RepID=A0A4Y3KHI6_CELUD|nr:class I SAM-dependent methyltransferase [Cellulomonas uda]NII66115.1 SAM-dependent methyltransferase [Cellulomonas uda]GEA82535.1 methyltransferase type 11 [Cellulomonas uda]
MVDPGHFERYAAVYAGARPPYPAALWEELRRAGYLTPGRRVLELGAGTGQATGPLLAAGLAVTAVEPGPRLAERLRATHPAASVVVARAEDVDLGEAQYDLAVAATSVHWLDLDVVLPAVHRALTPAGTFLVWRNVFGDRTVPTPFRARVAEVVARRTRPPRPGPDAEDAVQSVAALTRSGLFRADPVRTFRWSVDLDADQVWRLFTTFSDWTPDEVDAVALAVRDLGGVVTEHYLSWLVELHPC